MIVTRKIFFILLSLFIVMEGCKGKKKPSLSGDEPVEVEDFIEFFPAAKVPYTLADTSLLKKQNDSLRISHSIFTSFVPDSVIAKVFGKNVKPRFYPIARFSAEEEHYVLAHAFTNSKRIAWLIAFNKDNDYLDAMPFLLLDASSATQQLTSIDRNFGIHKSVSRKNADGSVSEGKDVFGFSAGVNKFSLIMTDALDDKITELINPIDTFSRKHKYAGDYGTGKLNIISIRDGRRADQLRFFIHIDKNDGACTGELKGDAVIRSPTVAEYRLGGDPCVLRFTFSASTVTLKEIEGCGAHRTLRCSFDGRYVKKKVTKKKS